VRVDVEAVRVAVVQLRALTPVQTSSRLIHQDIYNGLNALAERLVEEHGLDAVLRALAPHRADDNLAELLFHIFRANDRNMLPVFSEDEIVDAAARFLLPFRENATELIDERKLPGWGWHAVWQHDYDGPDHLTDEQHFRILLALIERVPMDDKILWMIGDGPLNHARESPEYRRQVETLEQTDQKIARAIQLDRERSSGTPYRLVARRSDDRAP
jgi:phosphoglycolate phosphatase-like HAD superfamily hydrolase